MICKTCGGNMVGDGYTVALHCENVDPTGYEPDCDALHCTLEEEDELERVDS